MILGPHHFACLLTRVTVTMMSTPFRDDKDAVSAPFFPPLQPLQVSSSTGSTCAVIRSSSNCAHLRLAAQRGFDSEVLPVQQPGLLIDADDAHRRGCRQVSFGDHVTAGLSTLSLHSSLPSIFCLLL